MDESAYRWPADGGAGATSPEACLHGRKRVAVRMPCLCKMLDDK